MWVLPMDQSDSLKGYLIYGREMSFVMAFQAINLKV